MRKNTRRIVHVALGCASYLFIPSLYAGEMGVESAVPSNIIPFVSLEGSASWVTTRNISIINNITSSKLSIPNNVNPWGGRVAAGLAYYYREHIDFTAEAGWNYFGDASDLSSGVTGLHIDTSLSGFDLLVGATYKKNKLAWFGKVGALIQRAQYSTHSSNLILSDIAGNLVDFSGSVDGTLVDVLPEIKVGALYAVNDALSISVAYMHAFGGDPAINESLTPLGGTSQPAILNLNLNIRNPSINSVLLGLRYSFI